MLIIAEGFADDQTKIPISFLGARTHWSTHTGHPVWYFLGGKSMFGTQGPGPLGLGPRDLRHGVPCQGPRPWVRDHPCLRPFMPRGRNASFGEIPHLDVGIKTIITRFRLMVAEMNKCPSVWMHECMHAFMNVWTHACMTLWIHECRI